VKPIVAALGAPHGVRPSGRAPAGALAELVRPYRAPAFLPAAHVRIDHSRTLARMRLEEMDAEVRAHEHAHVAALGKGVIVYDTVTGPDGSTYAVGGGVAVDLSPVPGDPEATIRKARIAIQAAYAAGEPSGADMKVAAEAYQLEVAAQRELEREQEEGGVHTWYA
jgi:hypothetical protein